MFQFKNTGLGMKDPGNSNTLPNTFGKVRTFKEDFDNFEKGIPAKDASEETTDLPLAAQKPVAENSPQMKEPLQMKPADSTPAPVVEYSPNNPFQSIPAPPPPTSSDGFSVNADTDAQLPPLNSAPSQSFFAEKPVSTENFSPEQTKDEFSSQKKSRGGLILTIIVILVIAIAGAGVYYYWFSIKNFFTATDSSTSTVSPAPAASPVTSPVSDDSQNKSLRNIVIDTSLKQVEVKNAVRKFATEFSESAMENDLIEAKIVGKDGQPIGKKDFFSGIGIVVPSSVMMKLSDDYSLFVMKEDRSAKLGLVFKSITSSDLIKEMKNWEPAMPTNLNPLYISPVSNETAAFNSNKYKNADIRYFNFSSPTNTSLDYSVISNFLVIGTSKSMTTAILDYMSEK